MVWHNLALWNLHGQTAPPEHTGRCRPLLKGFFKHPTTRCQSLLFFNTQRVVLDRRCCCFQQYCCCSWVEVQSAGNLVSCWNLELFSMRLPRRGSSLTRLVACHFLCWCYLQWGDDVHNESIVRLVLCGLVPEPLNLRCCWFQGQFRRRFGSPWSWYCCGA